MNTIQFRPLKEGDSNAVKALFHQLTDGNSADISFKELVLDPKCHCVVAEVGDEIIGFGSLVRHTVPSKGEVGRIEDVIIDEKYRGKGFGREIMKELISIAKEEDVLQINLTSSSLRVAARSLYKSLGFTESNTDVFMLKLK